MVGLWTVWKCKQFLVYILVFVNAEKTASSKKKRKRKKENQRMWLPYDLWVGDDITTCILEKKTAENLKHLELNVTFTAVSDVIYPL